MSKVFTYLENFKHANYFRLARILLFIVLVIHFIACILGAIVNDPSSPWLGHALPAVTVGDADVYWVLVYASCEVSLM